MVSCGSMWGWAVVGEVVVGGVGVVWVVVVRLLGTVDHVR